MLCLCYIALRTSGSRFTGRGARCKTLKPLSSLLMQTLSSSRLWGRRSMDSAVLFETSFSVIIRHRCCHVSSCISVDSNCRQRVAQACRAYRPVVKASAHSPNSPRRFREAYASELNLSADFSSVSQSIFAPVLLFDKIFSTKKGVTVSTLSAMIL